MRLFCALAAVAAFGVPLVLSDPYILHVLIVTYIFIIGAISLNLLLGYCGQLSLGHVAFFGIGAYASALTSLGFEIELFSSPITHEPWSPVFGFMMAILISGLCGYFIGRISFKVRGAYFVLVTISFAEVVRLVALNWVELTQGPLSLTNIPPLGASLPGIGSIALTSKVENYYLSLTALGASFLLVYRLANTRYGRAMVALRENESLAASCGIDVNRYLVIGTVISAAMAGAAGSIYAHYIRIIDPDIFSYTITMVIMTITGGKGTLLGPIVGGLLFGLLPTALRDVAGPELQWIVYGLLMIVVCIALPNGIVPAVSILFRKYSGSLRTIGRLAGKRAA